MAHYPGEIVSGLRLAMRATGATSGVVALKADYKEAVSAFEAVLEELEDVRLHLLGSYYPAGDEFVLAYDVLGRMVPEGGIPPEVGIVVSNVGTLLNVARAMNGVPVTHRYLTVAGEVQDPVTFRVPVGTLFGQVVEWAGGATDAAGRGGQDELALVAGGAMMGHVAQVTDVVTKTTGGLIVLPPDNPVVIWMTKPLRHAIRQGMSTCDQCRDCTDLCPRYLLGHELVPHEIMRSINYGLDQPTHIVTAAALCCECRLCEAYACPLGLSPMLYYREVKRKLAEAGWKNTVHRRHDLTAHEMLPYRRVPMNRLLDRLGLSAYRKRGAPLNERDWQPKEVRIPFKQHIGAPAEPVVEEGSAVKCGDLIATIPEGQLGANVHASIGGTVGQVTDEYVRIESG
jgi:Na+-translocating ferredoxin:NAD+ oxidoreductase RnfC subunit